MADVVSHKVKAINEMPSKVIHIPRNENDSKLGLVHKTSLTSLLSATQITPASDNRKTQVAIVEVEMPRRYQEDGRKL